MDDNDEEIIDTSSRVRQRVPREYESEYGADKERAAIRSNKLF